MCASKQTTKAVLHKLQSAEPTCTAEHAGQEGDEAAVKVGEKIEQAGENILDAAKGDKD